MKRWGRALGLVVGIVVALVLLLFALVHTPWARHYALSKTVALFQDQHVQLRAEQLRYNLARGSISARNVELKSTLAPGLPPFFSADGLEVTIDLPELLSGSYHVKHARVLHPVITVFTGADGRSNLPASASDKQPGGAQLPDFLIEYASVTRAELIIVDQQQRVELKFPSWNLEIEGNPNGRTHRLHLAADLPGTLVVRESSALISTLAAKASLERDALHIEDATLKVLGSTLSVAGDIRELLQPALELNAKIDANLQTVNRFVGPLVGNREKVDGRLQAGVILRGKLADLEADIDASGRDLVYATVHDASLNISGSYSAASRRIILHQLSLFSPIGRLTAQANVSTLPVSHSEARGEVRDIDIPSLQRLLADRNAVMLAARADGRFFARWSGTDLQAASGRADLHFMPSFSSPTKNEVPIAGNVSTTALARNLRLTTDDFSVLSARVQGDITLTRRKQLQGVVRIQVPALETTLPQMNAVLGRSGRTSNLAGRLDIEARSAGTLADPEFDLVMSAPSLRVATIQGVSVQAHALYTRQLLRIDSAQLKAPGQSASLQGRIGLQGQTRPIEFRLQAQHLSIATLLAGVGRQHLPIQGAINASAEVRGTLNAPQGAASLEIPELSAYGEDFGRVSASGTADGSTINISQLHMERPGPEAKETLDAQGSFNLGSQQFRFGLNTPGLTLRHLRMGQSTLPLKGTLLLDGRGSGTVADPNVQLSLRVRDSEIQGRKLGEIKSEIRVEQRHARVDAAAPGFGLSGRIESMVDSPYSATFLIAANETDLAKLPLAAERMPKGRVTAKVEGAVKLQDLRSVNAKLEIEPIDVEFRGQQITSDGPILAGYSGQTVRFDRLRLRAPGTSLNVVGSFPLASGDGDLSADAHIDIKSVLPLLTPDPKVTGAGTVQLSARVNGNLERIEPTATLSVQNVFLNAPGKAPPAENLNLRADVDKGSIRIHQLTGTFAGAQLQANAEIPLAALPLKLPVSASSTQYASLSAQIDHLNLGLIPAVPSKVKGTISLRVDLKAPRLDPNAATGLLTLPELKLNIDQLPVEQQGISRISLANGLLRIESFRLTGPSTRAVASGHVGITPSSNMDLKLDAETDIGVLASFVQNVRAQGPARIDLLARGTLATPSLHGTVALDNAQLSLPSPPLAIEGLNLRAEASQQRITISRLDGSLNGGRLNGSGYVSFGNRTIRDVDLKLGARNVFLNYPEGFRTASNLNLRLVSEGEALMLRGGVQLLEGAYSDPITISGNVTRFLRSGHTVDFTRERDPLLSRLRFNVDVKTISPIVIDNNLAELEASTDLQLVGTYYRPSIAGRLSVADGGQVLLNERRYVIDRGLVTFVNEQRIEPALDVLATTSASGYDITLQIGGEVGKTETQFTSNPPLAEPDIISVLLTGRTLEEARGSQTDVAKEQALALLAGGATGEISAGLQRATGLSLVRVEPSLISSETEPTARLTVGQDVTRNLSLVYSVDLRNSNDQIYLAEVALSRRFTTRALKDSDNSYRFEFRHDLSFGGPEVNPRLLDRKRPKIGTVEVNGNQAFPDQKLLDEFGVKPGKDYDFFKVRKQLDGLESFFARHDLLETRFQLERNATPQKVDLTLNVRPGPTVSFEFRGPADRGLQKEVRDIWQRGIFDAQRIAECEQAIRNSLVKDGYLRSTISTQVSNGNGQKQVVFSIAPGVKYRDVELVFPGATGISPDKLKGAMKSAKLLEELHTEPDKVTGFLQSLYAEGGYLDAKVGPRRAELNPDFHTGRLVIPIEEGPLYRVGEVRFAGNNFVNEATLRNAVLLAPGDIYKPETRDRSYDKILDIYLEQGFRNVEIEPSLVRSPKQSRVDVVFTLKENKQQVVKAVDVGGTIVTSPGLVHQQLAFKKDDVLSSTKLTESRRKLYRTGAYVGVDVSPLPMPPTPGLEPYQVPVRMSVKVQELPAYQVRYGASYDTDRGLGGVLDLTNRNTLGKARVVGLSLRADRLRQESRLYFSQPQLTQFPLKTDVSLYYTREDHDVFRTDRLGFTVQQESRWGNYYVYNFGYRIERSRSYATTDPLLRFTDRVAPLTAALTREKRDDILDARRGSFMSHAIEYGDGWLGSGLKFYKYFGQYANYLPLTKPSPVPFAGGVKKPRVVYAASVRVGIAGGLHGQDLLPSERFFAGGGTTVRGFENDSLGPRDPSGISVGGDAMFVLNNELRFPMYKMFEGVGFVDLGNVYARASDFRPWDVRKTIGAGLRVRTPYVLLRLDYGVKLDRLPGESAGKIFFSIGQAF